MTHWAIADHWSVQEQLRSWVTFTGQRVTIKPTTEYSAYYQIIWVCVRWGSHVALFVNATETTEKFRTDKRPLTRAGIVHKVDYWLLSKFRPLLSDNSIYSMDASGVLGRAAGECDAMEHAIDRNC